MCKQSAKAVRYTAGFGKRSGAHEAGLRTLSSSNLVGIRPHRPTDKDDEMPEGSFVKRSRIAVVGSANVDLTFRTPRLPVPGETLAGRSLHQGMGGKGANQAVVAARLGAEVAFIAKVGDDGSGQQALDAYTADGIDVSHVEREFDCPTGTAAIMVDDDADNCIIVVAGANAKLTAGDVQSARSVIERADAVLCQLETPVEAAIEAFRIARAAGVRTVLTPAPAELVTDELLSLCDVCVPNRPRSQRWSVDRWRPTRTLCRRRSCFANAESSKSR
ncbi:ribokinase [Rhodopirellula sallentina SM41]|uniref:Ribokinase n=1 Tax=Rhodopirellula sallentina SM41 TaxID=1263870 RepID=M5U7T1_9BACT|nr:ribokinase [Rhodopirellula sallentina SM41]